MNLVNFHKYGFILSVKFAPFTFFLCQMGIKICFCSQIINWMIYDAFIDGTRLAWIQPLYPMCLASYTAIVHGFELNATSNWTPLPISVEAFFHQLEADLTWIGFNHFDSQRCIFVYEATISGVGCQVSIDEFSSIFNAFFWQLRCHMRWKRAALLLKIDIYRLKRKNNKKM